MKWQCLARFKKKYKFFIAGYSELVLPRGFFVGYSYFFPVLFPEFLLSCHGFVLWWQILIYYFISTQLALSLTHGAPCFLSKYSDEADPWWFRVLLTWNLFFARDHQHIKSSDGPRPTIMPTCYECFCLWCKTFFLVDAYGLLSQYLKLMTVYVLLFLSFILFLSSLHHKPPIYSVRVANVTCIKLSWKHFVNKLVA